MRKNIHWFASSLAADMVFALHHVVSFLPAKGFPFYFPFIPIITHQLAGKDKPGLNENIKIV
jgi:hypothetical protein